MTKTYKFKFSFVIPVYNVADYLPETVESVICQTLDFKKNAEIIFVNDGSPDNVEEVCLHYKALYPGNIKYIKQENAGLSAARNRGLREVEGKYVSFLDSDDKISNNTLKEVEKFFDAHYDEIDFVALRVDFFEGKTGGHQLNYAIKGDRIVDIEKNWDDLHIQIASCFLKQEVFTERGYEFNPVIRRFAEDMELLGRLVLDKMRYGTVNKPIYYYRKRKTGGSIVDSSFISPEWYEQTPELVYTRIFDYAEAKFGYIPKYIQYMVMYDLQWRLRQNKRPEFDDEFIERYKAKLDQLYRRIDNDVIFAQRYIEYGLKVYVIARKYPDKKLEQLFDVSGQYLTVDGEEVIDLASNYFNAYVTVINSRKNTLTIEGMMDALYAKNLKQTILVDGVRPELLPTKLTRHLKVLGLEVYSQTPFKFEIDLSTAKSLFIELRTSDGCIDRIPLITRKNTRLNYISNYAYRVFDNYILRRKYKQLIVSKRHLVWQIGYEFMYELSLLKHKKIRSMIIRWLYFMSAPLLLRRDIWLISDRVNAAGDNGEALFKYLSTVPDKKNRMIYFVISKRSDDYKSVRRYGRVIDRYSLKYYLLFLFAKKVISSHADDFVINPYGRQEHNISDLFRFDFVFLQHGIIHGDLSKWLNKMNKNIKIFITTTKPEYESLIEGEYGYSADEVKLTGLPRYDLLENVACNKLILAPTWRHNLIGDADVRGVREYNPKFKNSQYYDFYQRLIMDEKINTALKEQGMSAEFYLHPSLEPQVKDFSGTERFKIKQFPFNYKNAFNEGSVLVSDFSSVVFDFAYLKKPVIYTQFDIKTYFEEHMHDKGYFEHVRDGFGPVVYTYEDSVEEIIKAIRNPNVQQKYLKRIENFYNWFDKSNSKRVYESIEALDNAA